MQFKARFNRGVSIRCAWPEKVLNRAEKADRKDGG
jgi:hypothetical protein